MSETPSGPWMHLYVWEDRFLYLGPGKSTTLHRNHAAVWLTTPGGEMKVTLGDGRSLVGGVVYIPSGVEYATNEAAAVIAALFWEPESAAYLEVIERTENVPRAFACPHTDAVDWQRLQERGTPLDMAGAIMARLMNVSPADAAQPAFIDQRIATALAFLRESPQLYGSLEALAEKVHLSPSRFAHLFKESVGVPVRRYVLWMKMRRALDLAIAGDSLTTAALSAGFADSAHLSRTVRSMMGIAPEFLFRHRERLVVHH